MKLLGIVKSTVKETRKGTKNGKDWEMDICEMVICERQSMEACNTPITFSVQMSQRSKLPSDLSAFEGKEIEVALIQPTGFFNGIARFEGRILSPIQGSLNAVGNPPEKK